MFKSDIRPGSFRARKDKQIRSLILMNFVCVAFLALVGTVFIFVYSDKSEANQVGRATTVVVEKQPAVKMVDILVPVRMIDANEMLQPAMFKQESRPESSISEKVVREFQEISNVYARSIIMPGEPLSRDFMTNIRPTNILTTNIPEGFRAVTIRIDALTGVEGWARAGARVDVSWMTSILGKPGLTVIVQNALVLSADRQISPNVDPSTPVPGTITVLVTSKDSSKIQLAANTGTITLSLRGDHDNGKGSGSSSLTVYDLLERSNDRGAESNAVEGFVRFSKRDGTSQEMVIMNGQVVRKDAATR